MNLRAAKNADEASREFLLRIFRATEFPLEYVVAVVHAARRLDPHSEDYWKVEKESDDRKEAGV